MEIQIGLEDKNTQGHAIASPLTRQREHEVGDYSLLLSKTWYKSLLG
ncbi:hypothetical protein MC7420_6694 [Coleofasciculus chthonoplastes PCC 7420]|uniref:Uncharacterized protein n=1 Tax=Coleofasciculus chthonoplastes PCC 7420 TaxID=118168 RepID=B4VWQ6_9CYAN|nr:hypothetical protein MC7420_6694 [Coleofasciculus chthonoplastes PCC 7420]